MKTSLKILVAAAALALTSGAAHAAEAGMKMDCCAKCDCCKDKAGAKSGQSMPDNQQHQQ